MSLLFYVDETQHSAQNNPSLTKTTATGQNFVAVVLLHTLL